MSIKQDYLEPFIAHSAGAVEYTDRINAKQENPFKNLRVRLK